MCMSDKWRTFTLGPPTRGTGAVALWGFGDLNQVVKLIGEGGGAEHAPVTKFAQII
jgi:hypothetical protein